MIFLVLEIVGNFFLQVCDIIDVYDDSQVRSLKEMKHIPDSIKLEEENEFTEDLDGIEFTNDIPMDEESDEEGFIDLDEI